MQTCFINLLHGNMVPLLAAGNTHPQSPLGNAELNTVRQTVDHCVLSAYLLKELHSKMFEIEGFAHRSRPWGDFGEVLGRLQEAGVGQVISQGWNSAGKIKAHGARARAQVAVAKQMAELGMGSEVREATSQAWQSAKEIESEPWDHRGRAQLDVFQEMAELAVTIRDKELLTQAWRSAAEIKDGTNRGKAQESVIKQMETLAETLHDKELLAQVWQRAGEFEFFHHRARVQASVINKMAAFAAALHDKGFLAQAWERAGEIEHEPNRAKAQADVAKRMKELGLDSEARQAMIKAWQSTEEIEFGGIRARAQCDVVNQMAELGMGTEARQAITQTWQSMAEIKEWKNRALAQPNVARQMAELGMGTEARQAITEAWRSAGKISEWHDRYSAQHWAVQEMTKIAMTLQDKELLDQAWQNAGELKPWSDRSHAEGAVVKQMAELAVTLQDKELLQQAWQNAGEVDDPDNRKLTQVYVAKQMAELGMGTVTWQSITQSWQGAEEIESRSVRGRDPAPIVRKAAELAVTTQDKEFFILAWRIGVEIKEPHRCAEAQAFVMEKMTELAVTTQDKELFVLAWWIGVEIKEPHRQSDAQASVIKKMAELAVTTQDKELLEQAWRSAREFEYLYRRAEAQAFVIKKMAELAVTTHDKELLEQSWQSAAEIKYEIKRAEVQADVAKRMAELGMGIEACQAIAQAWQAAGEIKHQSDRAKAQTCVAEQMAGITQSIQKWANQLADKLDGFSGDSFLEGVKLLLNQSHSYWARRVGTLPNWQELFPNNSLLQDLGRLGRVQGTLLSETERKSLRRQTIRKLRKARAQQDPSPFLIYSTTLQQLGDDPSTQALLELARSWRKKGSYQDPRFTQLISCLIKTKKPKALNFATRLLGEPEFKSPKEERPAQYRLWLLKKLCEAGHLEKELYDYLQKKLQEGVPSALIDRWLRGVVRELEITPSLEVMTCLLEGEWQDETGRLLKTPDEVIGYLQQRKTQFEALQDPSELVEQLASNPNEALFYYLLFGGRTHFALIDRYTPKKFEEMLDIIAHRVGSVHEGVMSEFESALMKALVDRPNAPATPREIMARLRSGQWPLGMEEYAQEIRIDISSEQVLQGLNERYQATFSPDQLGAMLQATLAPKVLREDESADPEIKALLQQIEGSQGLGELPAIIAELQERVPDLASRIEKRWGRRFANKLPVSLQVLMGLALRKQEIVSLTEFKSRVSKELRGELITIHRQRKKNAEQQEVKKRHEEEITRLQEASPEVVLVAYIESLLQENGDTVRLQHAAEWLSHLQEVFESLEKIGVSSGRATAKTITIRYLDKGRYLIEALRFADAAQCCFTSQNRERQVKWLTRIWKDPLSFVFLLEDNPPLASARKAIGFVFGSFGLKEGRPMVLLNGVYMQNKTDIAALAILNKIETDFSQPLRATHQFVAASHGGRTQLDPDSLHAAGHGAAYTNSPTEVTRLRALAGACGSPDSEIYDDLDVDLNEQATTKGHVWWKKID